MASKEKRQKEITKILERDGQVRASVVLAEATPKKAPLHDEFEWDDKTAAHQHRLSTARRIIKTTVISSPIGVRQRLVHVPVETITGPTAATSEREGVYKLVAEVAKDSGEYHRALRQLQSQVVAISRMIRELKRLAGETEPVLLPTLEDAMEVAKNTVRLMLQQAA